MKRSWKPLLPYHNFDYCTLQCYTIYHFVNSVLSKKNNVEEKMYITIALVGTYGLTDTDQSGV